MPGLFYNSYLCLVSRQVHSQGRLGRIKGPWEWEAGSFLPLKIPHSVENIGECFPSGNWGSGQLVFCLGVLSVFYVTISINCSNYIPFNFSVDVFPLLTSLSQDDGFTVTYNQTTLTKQGCTYLHAHQASVHLSPYLLIVLPTFRFDSVMFAKLWLK